MPKKKKDKIHTDVILVDVINFSKLNADQQYEIITFITKSYQRVIEKMLLNSNMSLERFIYSFISTGDGFFVDKHGKDKSAYIVWLRKDGIINPPNINFSSILEPKGNI